MRGSVAHRLSEGFLKDFYESIGNKSRQDTAMDRLSISITNSRISLYRRISLEKLRHSG
jgi:hypothetical protein